LLIQDITEVQPFDIELENKMIVMNKCDLAVDEPKKQPGVFYVSSLTGQGVGSLVEQVLLRLGVDEGSETPFLARKRHKISIENSLHFLNVSIKDLEEKAGLELVAESLRLAHEELGEVLRPMSSDDLLGEIFSEFCIGK
jgi:tRNA modification GTPase